MKKKYIILIVLILNTCLSFSNSMEQYLIKNIVNKALIENSSNEGFIVITNIHSCLTCNLSSLNGVFNDVLRETKNNIIPHLLIEVEAIKDSYFIKNELKNINIDEDTSFNYTKKFSTNYVLIYYNDRIIKYLKLNDIQDYFKIKVNNYLFGAEKDIKHSKQIEETEDLILNSFNVVDITKENFMLYDTQNYSLCTFDFEGKNIKNNRFYAKYQFLREGKNILDSLIQNGFVYFEAPLKMIYSKQNNKYYILYHSCIDSLFYTNAEPNISVTPLIACYDINFNLEYTDYLPLDNYCDFLIDSSKVDLLMSNFPNMMNDSNSIIISSKNLYSSDYYTSLNKNSIDSTLDIELVNFDHCDDFLLDSIYKFIFTFTKYKKIVFGGNALQSISMGGRVLINSDFKIISSLINKDFYHLMLSDENNFYIQTYNFKLRKYENEQKYKMDKDIIESVLLDYQDGQLILLNKRKKTRWSIDFY